QEWCRSWERTYQQGPTERHGGNHALPLDTAALKGRDGGSGERQEAFGELPVGHRGTEEGLARGCVGVGVRGDEPGYPAGVVAGAVDVREVEGGEPTRGSLPDQRRGQAAGHVVRPTHPGSLDGRIEDASHGLAVT